MGGRLPVLRAFEKWLTEGVLQNRVNQQPNCPPGGFMFRVFWENEEQELEAVFWPSSGSALENNVINAPVLYTTIIPINVRKRHMQGNGIPIRANVPNCGELPPIAPATHPAWIVIPIHFQMSNPIRQS